MTSLYRFQPDCITEHLSKVSVRHRIAYAAACCERMLPNYVTFAELTKSGNSPTLRTALDHLWAVACGAEEPGRRTQELLQRCIHALPDSEDFPMLRASHALDAGAGICEALGLCLDGQVEHITAVVTSARDTVHMFIQDRYDLRYDDPDFERIMLNDPLMQREMRHQTEDVALPFRAARLDEQVASDLRARYEGKSSIR